MTLHPNILAQVRKEAEYIAELTDDEEVRYDTLDGQVDLDRLFGDLLKAEAEANAMADMNEALERQYGDRAKACRLRADKTRAAMQRLMDAAGLQKVKHPYGTLSIGKGRVKLVLDEGFEPPQGYARVTVSPDKTAIKKALEAGETMPGARLEEGDPVLTVRRK